MKKTIAFLMCTMILAGWLLISVNTEAAVITYTSRSDWEAAVGTFFEEDFSGFSTDASFRTSAVDVGPFSLEQIGTDAFRNIIDVTPYQYSDNNGTTHASMFTNYGLTTVKMTFDDTFSSWGANFYGTLGAELLDFEITLDTGGTLTTLSLSDNFGFFGFTSDSVLRGITFESRTYISGGTGEGFGLDNVVWEASAAPVPEPSTMILLGFGLVGIAGITRRKMKK